MKRTRCGLVLVAAIAAGCAARGGADPCTGAKADIAHEHDAAAKLAPDLAIAKEAARRELAGRIDAEGRAARSACGKPHHGVNLDEDPGAIAPDVPTEKR